MGAFDGVHPDRRRGRAKIGERLRDPAEAAACVAGLEPGSPVMRFWAAQGLPILAVERHPLPTGVDRRFASETDPHVRIAVAEALGHAGDAAASIRCRTGVAAEGPGAGPGAGPGLRHRALEALICLPPMPALSLEMATAASTDADEYVRGAGEHLRLTLRGEYVPTSPVFNFALFNGADRAGITPMNAVGPGRAGG